MKIDLHNLSSYIDVKSILFTRKSESLNIYTDSVLGLKSFIKQTKSYLVSKSTNTFANGSQYFLEEIGQLNTNETITEVFLVVKESESNKKVVLGIENKSNITDSAKVTDQIISIDPELFNLQLWVKLGNLSQMNEISK